MFRSRQSPQADPAGGISRRGLVGMLTTTAALGVGGFVIGTQLLDANEPEPLRPEEPASEPDIVEFDGFHQAGIATPAQSNIVLTAYDLDQGVGKAELAALMKEWTRAARSLTSGGSIENDPDISVEGGPANLTMTLGVGAGLVQRFGATRPRALVDLPAFAGDAIDQARSGGDLVVQLCADDPLVLAQADRVLERLARGTLTPRWQQSGFGSTGARKDGRTGRNLMGQLDGTNNVTTSQLATSGPIWVDQSDPSWMTGGSYLVVRRIRMLLREWDEQDNYAQEAVIGRTKRSGAPLGSDKESDFVDLEAVNPDGSPTIPADSHVRIAAPRSAGENMMRRGYSYRDAVGADGVVDQGLLFLAYQKDPSTSFVPVQERMSSHDALTKFTQTTGSAVFAMLPGTGTSSGWLGSALWS